MPSQFLIILDCDGVLVDSERITNALLAEVATEHGWPTTRAESIARFKGKDLSQVQSMIEDHLGTQLGEGFIPDYRVRMAERFETEGVPPISGAADMLDWLDTEGILHAVASNAPHSKMHLTLGRITTGAGPFQAPSTPTGAGHSGPRASDWFTRFEGRRFSAYDIDRWKPDPALFLHTARVMGAAPESCIVVEDSTSGIKAAAAAGMRVVGFADLSSPAELTDAGATTIASTIAEVMSVLRSWIGSG